MKTASDEILTVKNITMEGGDATVVCPHCKQWVGLDRGEPRGEQFNHKACGGWFEVSHTAKIHFYVPE